MNEIIAFVSISSALVFVAAQVSRLASDIRWLKCQNGILHERVRNLEHKGLFW